MHPELTLFGLTLKSYSALTCAAAAAGAALAWPALRRCGLSAARRAALLLAMCAAFLLGARLWNAAVNPAAYGGSLHWYSLRMTGFSLYGGIAGSMAALLALLRLWRCSAFPVLDALTVPAGVAFCIARVGCFLNGCCGGTKTHLPWGVVFPAKKGALSSGLFGALLPAAAPVHPTQLYELLGAAAGLPLACWLARRLRLRPGGRFLLYGVWLCAVRCAVLPLRALNYAPGVREYLYPALYLGLMALGMLLLLRRGKTTE